MNEEKANERLLSLDTYRGLVLVMLLLESVKYGWQHELYHAHPSWLTRLIDFHASHVAWAGCSMWDLIQPSFMFMVGVSMAYSYGKRLSLGDSFGTMFKHAVIRALVLILLGVFLRTTYTERTNWTFEDVITQMGLGYVFLFLLWNKPFKIQAIALCVILVGYWMLFALWPVRDAIPDPAWSESQKHVFTGFFAHWNINANPGHYFDQWFLNLFPRESPFEQHDEGYNTLNFIPSLGIMIMGLMAGEWLRSTHSKSEKWKKLVIYGGAGVFLGAVLHFAGICPLVKKAWTSGFTLFSGGWCLLILAALYYVVDVQKKQRWTFPFVVCGMNSIALYCMIWLAAGSYPISGTEDHFDLHWVDATLQKHLGENYAAFLGKGFESLLKNLANGVILWLVCFWMYRRKIFLRI
jgi:heparan-alpha-glucosaminide N-acetyltransferase